MRTVFTNKKLRNIPELVQENKNILINMEKPLNFRFLKYRSINMNSHVILKKSQGIRGNTHVHEKIWKYLAKV